MELANYLGSAGRGSISRLARDVGAHVPDMSRWARKQRIVPVQYCLAIERATEGAVTRRDLRPTDWHLIWPELAEPTPQEVSHG